MAVADIYINRSTNKLILLDISVYIDAGCSLDPSPAVLEKLLFHLDGVYKFESFNCTGYVCKTNTRSNMAFRGYGAP